MKREYEGESIPSQSLAQQDEPVQQMNLHEAGEEMPTRTLCKKLKTYSRRKLLKGTTSTNPSKSASPAGSTPANEDRTRADNQVAAADTPFSTPANEDRTRADNQVAADDTPFSTPANEDRTRADNQVAAADAPFSTPANDDRTRADNQVAAADTPLQSLAQQDEPVQQMSLHEAGEEMSTRRSCKKLKTYSRRKLLKGTTSTNPSKSATSVGSTPANEDRTRADNQVAADDTPFSTPANDDRTRADNQVAAADAPFSTPANDDRTRADNQVAADDTPLQSLAQQDEPVQQMNLHEAGEEMSTRRSCKKLKTYSRRKLLKGTTSTNPSKSATSVGSIPANEDRTRADNQVAADDTPFSTPANDDRTRADNQVAAADAPFSTPANDDRTRADNQVAAADAPFSTPANDDRTRADNQVAADDTPLQSLAQQDEPVQQMSLHEAGEEMSTRRSCKKLKTYSRRKLLKGTTSTNPSKSATSVGSTPANEDRTRAYNQVAADDTPFCTPANDDRTRADNQVAAADAPFSTPANDDRTRADNQVAADDTPFSTFDKDGVEGTVIAAPDCPVKFDNLEDFFARVSGQIKRAHSLSFSADQSFPMDDKISATQKSTPSAEMLATAKADIERLLILPSQYMLLPENCSALSAALSIYAAAPDLSAERTLDVNKLKENLPHFFATLRRAQKDQAEFYKVSAKSILLIDELRKDQELYAHLKDCTDKLEYQISMRETSLKVAKTKIAAIQEQKLNLARRCFQKSSAFDKFEAEFPVLTQIKKLADSDTTRLEESLKDFKSKIID